LFSGNVLSADEAESIGLVSEVKADDEMTAFVESVLTRFINTSPLSMKNMKHLVTKGMRMDVMSGLRMEIDCAHEYATQSNDANEGLRAFSEKRKPKFNGK
jgi:enoyl-CoA hydratase/carnithine racemase